MAPSTLSAALLIARGRRDQGGTVRTWRAVRIGALALVIGLVVAGGLALVAFDVLFEVFHTLLFPGGSYTFDPSTGRLVQLFPFRFWQETAILVGIVAVILGLVVAAVATSRRGRGTATADGAPAGVVTAAR